MPASRPSASRACSSASSGVSVRYARTSFSTASTRSSTDSVSSTEEIWPRRNSAAASWIVSSCNCKTMLLARALSWRRLEPPYLPDLTSPPAPLPPGEGSRVGLPLPSREGVRGVRYPPRRAPSPASRPTRRTTGLRDWTGSGDASQTRLYHRDRANPGHRARTPVETGLWPVSVPDGPHRRCLGTGVNLPLAPPPLAGEGVRGVRLPPCQAHRQLRRRLGQQPPDRAIGPGPETRHRRVSTGAAARTGTSRKSPCRDGPVARLRPRRPAPAMSWVGR